MAERLRVPIDRVRLVSAGLGTRAPASIPLALVGTRSNRADCAMGIWYS